MRKAVTRILLALAIVTTMTGFLGAGSISAADGSLPGWANKVQMTIDRTKISGTLTNFPVLVHLSAASGLTKADVSAVFSTLGANSKKLAVTTSDGTTQCPVEVIRWDSASKQAYLWVKVPSVSNTADTILYLYYDAAQPDNTAMVGDTGSAAAQNVWDGNYVMVQHLAQNGKGAAGEYLDSTSRHHNGQGAGGLGYGTPAAVTTDSPMGVSQSFNGSNNYINVPDSDDFTITTTGDLTVSMWISPSVLVQPTSTGYYTRFLGKSSAGQHEWFFEIFDLGGKGTDGGNRSQWISNYVLSPSGGAGSGENSKGAIGLNEWVYVTGTFHGDSPTQGIEYLYRGPCVETGTADGWSAYGLNYRNGTAPFTIGTGWLGSGNFFAGRIGEVRVSNVTRSKSWIAASYYSESDALVSYKVVPATPNPVAVPAPIAVAAPAPAPAPITVPAPVAVPAPVSAPAPAPIIELNYGPAPAPAPAAASAPSSAPAPSASPAASPVPTPTPVVNPVNINSFGLNNGDSISHNTAWLNAQRFQNTIGSGTLTRLEVLVNDTVHTGKVRLGVYADNNGVPGSLLLDAGEVTAENGWTGIGELQLPVASGSFYWLAVNAEGLDLVYQSTGMPDNSHAIVLFPYGPLPTSVYDEAYDWAPFVMRATINGQ